jgi:hypothetical protein
VEQHGDFIWQDEGAVGGGGASGFSPDEERAVIRELEHDFGSNGIEDGFDWERVDFWESSADEQTSGGGAVMTVSEAGGAGWFVGQGEIAFGGGGEGATAGDWCIDESFGVLQDAEAVLVEGDDDGGGLGQPFFCL